MKNNEFKFPNDFLWGASTSAFQVEGGHNEAGKGIATSDTRTIPKGLSDNLVASDHFHRWQEDIDLMKELGIKIYRFSFMWSRIMPDGWNVNVEGLKFYDQLIDKLLECNIIPFPTLYHFEMPQALIDEFGGWQSRKCIDAYVKYANVCFHYFKDKVKMWATINEQMCASAPSDFNGNVGNSKDEAQRISFTMSYHMSLAEKLAMQDFRKIIPDGKIGPVCAIQVVYPKTSSPEDVVACNNASDIMQWSYLDMSVRGRYPISVVNYLNQKGYMPSICEEDKKILISEKPDFIGINYYQSLCVRKKQIDDDNSSMPPFFQNDQFFVDINENLPKTEWMQFGIDPEGLYTGMRDIYERYLLPLIVTENGMAYSDELINGKIHDDYRIDYLSQHLKMCQRFIDEGYPLMGYSPWSFMDLVSSHQGFMKRYGLVYINSSDNDLKDLKRIPKESFYWYQKLIKESGR